MRKLWGDLQVDIAILGVLVVVLLTLHVFIPQDDLIGRLAGEGFAAFLAILRGAAGNRKAVEQ